MPVPVYIRKQCRSTDFWRLALIYRAVGLPTSGAGVGIQCRRSSDFWRRREVCAKSVDRLLASKVLRSASHCDLIIPKHRTKFAEHAFIVVGPLAWNRLPQAIHEAPSLITFRRLLKNICLRLLTQTVDYVQYHCRVRYTL